MDPNPRPDPRSSERAASFDVEALLRERAWLVGLARSLGSDDATAEDLVQEALVQTIARPPRALGSPRAFLATVLRRVALKIGRGESRRRAREVASARSERLPDSGTLAAEVEAQRAVVEAVLALDEPYRRTVMLRYFRGVETKTIAAEEGVAAATIDTRLHRAIGKLRARLDKRFGDRAAWRAPLLLAAAALAVDKAAVAGTIVKSAASASKWSSPAGLAGSGGVSTFGKSLVVGLVLVVASGLGVLTWRRAHDESRSTLTTLATDDSTARSLDRRDDVAGSSAPRAPFPVPERESVKSNDGASTPAGDAADGGIIDLVDAGGRPISGASLVFLDAPQDAAAILKTDESGHVSFPRNALGSRRLVVAAASRAPRIVDCVLRLGENRIEIDGGFALAGRVRVNGHEPRSPLRLSFEYAAGFPEFATDSSELPTGIANLLQSLTTETASDGSFEFGGLPSDTHGEVRFDPWAYYVNEDSKQSLVVASPAQNVVIDLDEYQRIKGIVIDSQGRGVAAASVVIQVLESGLNVVTIRRTTTDTGEFDAHLGYHLDRHRRYTGQVAIEDPERIRHRQLDFSIVEESVIDLGSIALADSVYVEFQVVDENGNPLSGVIGYRRQGLGAPSKPTDESGLGGLTIAKNTDERDRCWFATPGREIVESTLAAGQVTRVIMQRASEIELSLARRDGADVGTCFAELVTLGERPLADPSKDLPPPALEGQSEVFRGAHCTRCSMEDGNACFGFEVTSGISWLRRIRPNVRFDLVIRSTADVELYRSRDLILDPGETRKVFVTIDTVGRALFVHVLDPSGNPVCDAEVVIERGIDVSSPRGLTDTSGTVAFLDVAESIAIVSVRARGYPVSKKAIDVATLSGLPLEIRLEAGRGVELSIVDVNGRAIEDGAAVRGGIDSEDDQEFVVLDTRSRELGGGRYAFDELPATGRLRFEVTLGGVVYSLVHDSPAPTATLVVPAQGRVRLSWDLDLKTNYLPFYRFVPIGGGEPIVLDVGSFDPREAHGSDVIPEFRPGRYRVEMSVKEDDAPERRLAVSVAEIEVIAGKTSEVVLVAP